MTGVTVSPEASDATLFDTIVADLQTGLAVTAEPGGDGAISGTLKYLDTGPIADYWGEGHFMALRFQPGDEGATVSVGLEPSEGSGLVPLDEDLNGVFKVTDPAAQVFRVVTEKDGETKTQTFALQGLTLEPGPVYPEMSIVALTDTGEFDLSLSGKFRAAFEAMIEEEGAQVQADLSDEAATFVVDPPSLGQIEKSYQDTIFVAKETGTGTLTVTAPINGVMHQGTAAVTVTA